MYCIKNSFVIPTFVAYIIFQFKIYFYENNVEIDHFYKMRLYVGKNYITIYILYIYKYTKYNLIDKDLENCKNKMDIKYY